MTRSRKPSPPKDASTAKSSDEDLPGESQVGERIAKLLARAGVASRHGAEAMIAAGRVSVDGVVLATPAVKVAPGQDVRVDGEPIAQAEPARLFRYHKPAGLLVTRHDPEGRPTVFDHLPKELPRLMAVGRLDFNSEGLLLLTNDGGLARVLELPSTGWIRRYRVRAHGRVTQGELDKLAKGLTVDGERFGPIRAKLEATKDRAKDRAARDGKGAANVWITVALEEGKKREVRRALETLGLTVNRLIRVAYGPFQLGALERGEVAEVPSKMLREQLGGKLKGVR
jgi:23S rRNA pseudouridine2605 synthase